MNPTIIKCGGSLLGLPDLPRRLLSLHDREALWPAVVLVGGGAAVDGVRAWDRQHHLASDVAHDLAIAAMTLNARMLISADPRFCPVTTLKQAAQRPEDSVGVLISENAIRQLETQHPPLPRSWNITSDSIAAWLAQIYTARLLLLKSVPLPKFQPPSSMSVLVEAGLVDSCFPIQSAGLPFVDWCDLTADTPTIQRIQHNRSAAEDG